MSENIKDVAEHPSPTSKNILFILMKMMGEIVWVTNKRMDEI